MTETTKTRILAALFIAAFFALLAFSFKFHQGVN